MRKKSLAIGYVSGLFARKHYYESLAEARSHVNDVTAGYGNSEGAALTDAIARGNLSPTTLDDVKHGGQAEFWHTPFGVVLTNQG